jgi:hypothetical protein
MLLIVVVPVACLALMALGLVLVRVAALSDESHRLAVSEWLASVRSDEVSDPGAPVEERLRRGARGRYRATG